MQRNPHAQSGRFNPRILAALGFCSVGTALAVLSLAGTTDQSSLGVSIRQGDVVVPSEFRGNVRNLPQTISDAQRKSFIRPLELEPPPTGAKQLLPGAPSAAPSTVTAGAMALAAIATPLTSPPPPIGTTSVSISGASSRISTPTVAAPAITSASLYGEMNVAPVSAAYFFARRSASS